MLIFIMWLGSVFIKATRADGNQILVEKGDYFDCCEGWYDDQGNVFIGKKEIDRFFAVGSFYDGKSFFGQEIIDQLPHTAFIIHNKYF